MIYAVSMKHERPGIPESCPQEFRELIERCWHRNVEQRPRAKELVRLLDVLYEEEHLRLQQAGFPSE